jgi:DNA invertase Pin-like site-specific DNA recombinase
MKVIAYIRVSTEMQDFSNQEYEIKRFCAKSGLKVTEWISESISGTIRVEKRQLGKAIEAMGKGDLLICSELSRLGRNMLMIMGILNVCSTKGISIHTIKDNFELSDSINSKIIAFAFALAAEIERNLISQRTKEALAVRKMKGIRLGRPPGSSRKRESFKEQHAEIQFSIENGEPMSVIARRLGVHRNTLRKYINEMRISEDIKI